MSDYRYNLEEDRQEAYEEGFAYLDVLRESGQTNMFGARPYVQEYLGCEEQLAKKILTDWMKTFDGETPSTERVSKALGGDFPIA